MSDFKLDNAPSKSVGSMERFQTDSTSQRQTEGGFASKMAEVTGNVIGVTASGAQAVFGALGMGAVAAPLTSRMGQVGGQLAASGQVQTGQLRGATGIQDNTGSPTGLAAAAPSVGEHQVGSAAALPMGPTAAASAQVSTASSAQAAFGAGAMSLPGSGGGTAIAGGSFGNGMGGAVGAAAGGDSQTQLLQATREMQEGQMSFNLQYLQLQSQMQHENRSYTAVSNIMKTKHDTVKNSISNIR